MQTVHAFDPKDPHDKKPTQTQTKSTRFKGFCYQNPSGLGDPRGRNPKIVKVSRTRATVGVMLELKSSAYLLISPGIHLYGLGVEEQIGVILNLRKALYSLKLQLRNLNEFRVPVVSSINLRQVLVSTRGHLRYIEHG